MASEIEAPLPQRLIDNLSKVSDLTSSVLEDALKSLTKVDGTIANTSIISAQRVEKDAESVMDKLFDFRLSQKTVVAVRLALESLKRISEYGEDVAEMTINLTARRRELY
jgi:phosphate uptake regulator